MGGRAMNKEEARAALDLVNRYNGNIGKAARESGIAENTLRTRFVRASQVLNQPDPIGDKRELYKLQKENKDLRQELRQRDEQVFNEDEAKKILGTASEAEAKPPHWLFSSPARKKGAATPEVPVIMLCDWHMGETVKKDQVLANEYNKKVAELRAWRVTGSAMSLAKEYGPGNYPGAVVNLLGDFISGWLHSAQISTDWAPPAVCALEAFDLLVAVLDHLLEQFGSLYVPCAAGNHGRMTPKPEFTDYVYKNWDWVIYQLLIRHYSGNKHIVIDCRPSNEIFFRIWRTRFLACHGDMLGVQGGDGIIGAIGPITRGEIKTRGMAMSIVSDYDFLLMGHWHQPLWLPRAFISNTLKGYCPYAKLKLKAPPTAPSQHMFYVHPDYGVTSRWELFADEKKHGAAPPPWATVLASEEERPKEPYS